VESLSKKEKKGKDLKKLRSFHIAENGKIVPRGAIRALPTAGAGREGKRATFLGGGKNKRYAVRRSCSQKKESEGPMGIRSSARGGRKSSFYRGQQRTAS